MAANLAYHNPIRAVMTETGFQPFMPPALMEKSGQTWAMGAPLQVSGGYLQVWDGTTVAQGIAGVSKTYGSNLGTSGKGAPGAFGSVGAPGALQTFGSVPNQANAVNIAHGAPFTDGRVVFEAAVDDTIFEAQIDNSAAGAYASAVTQIGVQYGLTADASSPAQWYIDLNKTTAGTNTVLIIIGFNPLDAVGTNAARAWFKFLHSVQQLTF